MRHRDTLRTAALVCFVALAGTATRIVGTADFAIDAGASRVVIEVGKAGVLGFAGHAHEVLAPAVSGSVALDTADWSRSSVSLEFTAAALRVTGAGEPPADVPEVQRTMLGERVLDVERFSSVSFRSTRIVVAGVDTEGGDLRIEGALTLHGVTRPLTVPVHVTLDGDGALSARGAFSLRQSAYGIQPVTAAGGTIRTKDDVNVRFELKARR